ncbi:hypothetical protein Ccrd_008658 [Cynara cardunculus var. scolymus]|uniref:Uncharacterized protein n=1 Tax=Cynara cardunculus var. scolymus TaxID=59895 RepID=A0A103XEU2_CYNCS|nr:hypothetical protein Ccrd_008658 [Cynara cardunculus var. scolymus]
MAVAITNPFSSLILSLHVVITFHQWARPFSSHLQQTVLGGFPWPCPTWFSVFGSSKSFTLVWLLLDVCPYKSYMSKSSSSFMDKPSESAKGDSSVEREMRQILNHLNDLRNQQPKDDVPPPPHIFIDLSSPEEDMEVFKEQYKVLGSPSVAASASVRCKNLGFDNGCVTFMCIRDKKVQFPGKSLYALGRSWFKEGFTEKDKAHDVGCIISFPVGSKEKEKAKARARIAEKKGKRVQKKIPFAPTPANKVQKEVCLSSTPVNKVQKKVHFAPTPPPHRGEGIRKKRFVPKMRSLRAIMASTKRMPDA